MSKRKFEADEDDGMRRDEDHDAEYVSRHFSVSRLELWLPTGRSHSIRSQPHREFADEDGAGAGGGGAGEIDEILKLVEQAPDLKEMDEQQLKLAVARLKKSIDKNVVMRSKHPDEPDKFMDSELDLDECIKALHPLATVPALYPTFVALQVTPPAPARGCRLVLLLPLLHLRLRFCFVFSVLCRPSGITRLLAVLLLLLALAAAFCCVLSVLHTFAVHVPDLS